MSTPAPPRSPGALHAAQQQLDELDALIQRMLTLPPNPGEEPAPADTPAEASVETPSEPKSTPMEKDAASRSPRKLEGAPPAAPKRPRAPSAPPASAPDDPFVELLPTPLLDPLEVEFRPVPLASDLLADGEDEVLAPAEPFHAESPAAQYEEAADEYGDEEAERETVAAPTPRRGPLVRVNQGFDRLTYPFGRAGYWLRSGIGRDVLGWVGVMLITGSMAWAILDWLGWTW